MFLPLQLANYTRKTQAYETIKNTGDLQSFSAHNAVDGFVYPGMQRKEIVENNINESLKLQALKEEALRLWAVDQQSALDLGKALIAVREALAENHGAFAAWFRENGLEENRVYYCIRKAEGKTQEPVEEENKVCIWPEHLALASLCPTDHRQLPNNVVHLGPDGITVTDGYLLARVSLGDRIGTDETVVPVAMLERGTDVLSFGKTRISSKKDGVTKTMAIPNVDYPPYQKQVLGPALEKFNSDEGMQTVCLNTKRLRQLCDFIDTVQGRKDEGNGFSLKIADTQAYTEIVTAHGFHAEMLMMLVAKPREQEKPKSEAPRENKVESIDEAHEAEEVEFAQ